MTTAYSMSVRFLINMSAHHDLALFRLSAAFKELAGSRILLTGGTGFVGKWLLQTAKDAQTNSLNQVEIVVPTRQLAAEHVQSAMKIGCPNVSWIEGNFLEEQIDIGKVDMIVHAATPASAKLNAEDPSEMLRVNIAAMESVLRLAGNNTPLLFTSSGAVYGTQPESMAQIPERSIDPSPPRDQLNAYAQGKQAAERMCKEAGEDGRCRPIIARLFAFGGEYLPRDTHFAIGNFVQNILDRKPIEVIGDGRARRSYLYGADMATWLWSALANGGAEKPFHIGSENSISILELAQAVAKASNQTLNFLPEIKVAQQVDPAETVHQYVPANSDTREVLQVSEWTSLEDTINAMLLN
jgi:dTDP-glucose 4,6-dehydratase